MSEALLNRVYDLRVANYDDSLAKVAALTKAFDKMDASKKKLNESLQRKLEAGDAAAVQELTKRLAELEKEMKNVSVQREKSAKEVELLAKAELSEAKAKTELAKATRLKQQADIDANKELDRQIALEQKAAKATKDTTGYYYELLAAQKQTLEVYRQTFPDNPLYESVKKGALDAKRKVDDFNRSLSPDGTLVGEYKTGILNAFTKLGLDDVIKKQGDDIKRQLSDLIAKNKQLANEYRNQSKVGGDAFEKIDRELAESIRLQEQMEANLKHINTSLAQTGSVGGQITGALSNEFKNLKSNITQVAIGYVGFQAAVSGTQTLIKNSAELSDKFVDLKRILGATKNETDAVVESLKKIDTRTSLTSLVDTSIIAAKAGVAKENIAGVTKALDELQLVAGKELGNVEQTTTSLVKLINIFEGPGKTSEENIRRYGNALVELANKGVASGGYLVDYAQRLAGIEGITKIQINSVLGLAAAFEEQGQSGEVAATATTQIISKIGADVEKFASIAGKTKEAFQDTLRSNPAEALIQVAQGVKGNATAFDEIAPKFADVEAKGVRVQSVLGVLADKSDFFRDKIKIAGVALQNTTAITEGAADKQTTFAAVLDKVSKKFELIGTNKTLQFTLLALASTFSFLIGALPVLITLTSLYGLGWLTLAGEMKIGGEVMKGTNAQLLLQKAQLIGNNILLGITKVYTAAATVVQSSYNAAMALYTGVATRSAVATTLFGNAVKNVIPGLGIILTLLGLLAFAYTAMSAGVNGTTEALKDEARQKQINNEISKIAEAQIAKETVELVKWFNVATSANASLQTKQFAIQKLIDQFPLYFGNLKAETATVEELAAGYLKATDAIKKKAFAQASSDLASKKQSQVTEISALKIQIEREFVTQNAGNKSKSTLVRLQGLTESEQAILTEGLDRSKEGLDVNNGGASFLGERTYKELIKRLDSKLEQRKKVAEDYAIIAAKYEKELEDINKSATAAQAGKESSVFARFQELVKKGGKESDFDTLKKDVAAKKAGYTIISKEYKDLKKLEDEIAEYLNPKNKKDKASRVSGADTDQFRLIDANRDTLLAKEETALLKKKQNDTLTYQYEVDYTKKIEKINADALLQKIDLLNKKGKLNAEETLKLAEFNKSKVDLEIKLQSDLDALAKKQSDAELKKLNEAKTTQQRVAKDAFDEVNDDPNTTATERLNAKKIYDSQLYFIENNYLDKVKFLHIKYKQDTTDIEQKASDDIKKIRKDLNESTLKEFEAAIQTIEQKAQPIITKINAKYNELISKILANDKFSDSNKKSKIDTLKKAQELELAATELTKAQDKLKEAEDNYNKNPSNQNADILEKYRAEVNGKKEILLTAIDAAKTKISDVKGVIQTNLEKLFNVGAGSEESKAIATILAESYNIAQTAMSNYFESERQNIERSKQLVYERIDLETAQLKNKAQSNAERDSLDKQAAAKKKAVDKEAFEENKKIQKEQAKINLAVQLSNIAASAFSPANPLNLITGGIWGAAFYALQAGLAIVAYSQNISRINSAKFATGGLVRNYSGQRITDVPNIPTQSNGDNIFATVRKGEVVLNEQQQAALGGARTFAAIKVPGFATGGYTGLGDFALGENLKPPFNPASYLLPNNNNQFSEKIFEKMDSMMLQMKQNNDTINSRVDRLKVQVVAKEVETTNNDTKKAESIGTL